MVDEARRLAAELSKKALTDYAAVAAVVAKGAHNLKNQYREDAESNGTTRHFAGAIGYDTSLSGLSAEVGPDKDKPQGPLGVLLYFGSSDTAPVLDFDGPIQDEEPKFNAAIEGIVGNL